jgi:small subunit ribosomal protein S19
MSRSSWKGSYVHYSILKCKKIKINIWSRSSVIPSSLINKTVLIHFGNAFRKLYVKQEHIGFKFGEFAYTRKKNLNAIKKSKKSKKTKK